MAKRCFEKEVHVSSPLISITKSRPHSSISHIYCFIQQSQYNYYLNGDKIAFLTNIFQQQLLEITKLSDKEQLVAL